MEVTVVTRIKGKTNLSLSYNAQLKDNDYIVHFSIACYAKSFKNTQIF